MPNSPASSRSPAPVLSDSAGADLIDAPIHAALARSTSSLSIASAWLASTDWAIHLAMSPGKCLDLARLALSQTRQLAHYAGECMMAGPTQAHTCVAPPKQDRRFSAPEWQQWPFNLMHQGFLLQEQWWAAATHGVWGVEKHHENVVAFMARQLLDLTSPGNLPATNPVVLKRTVDQGGGNLMQGALNALDDMQRLTGHQPPAGTEEYVVGRDVGITPGKVVLRTRVMELIQYSPTTATVHPEPVLIVPAWIMKYYILDLSPHNSLIKYLVDHGHTVFCISWKNPGAEDRDLGMDDYLEHGFHAALGAVCDIVPKQKVHAAGYCLGGTLLAIAAAAMARDGDTRLASMTLFAAQTDFSEPGELALFIDESQVSLLEAQMNQTGYLTAGQMAGAFQMLRSYDLFWSKMVNEYLLGERAPMNDLMAWNADATRMPARMHSQYLRRLFLDDDLSEGRYPVGGKPVALADIALPTFIVGTETDHVAPWRSVYKLHHMTGTEITFVLTNRGHNAGIVSPPDNPRHHFRMLTRAEGRPHLAPDDWLALAPETAGSWWPAWHAWLEARSGAPVKPPRTGSRAHVALCDAPGSYVMEK
ncbi:MAG: alpha/beta fold hydrolase [Gammaproteobacteria bacterium]|jgi:polyhydroxyalkanoate synthase subunit PhaC|nr:alpha/beta fold hydrolase [Gammaproteobacteria bacterium]MBU0773023.1 alpha/beta fold hydrolase [Gammaproteobacteria bacterium]MBU0858179.1 alpha/beta fold hydrolase [Gammaproteobacteria bacterium]MBU1846907.1 alpha/beta fold hydrolase [Gammaproteobacteria bacterium]